MKVLLNSDVAYSQGLRSDLTKQLAALAEACKERGFEIVLPLTTVLEFERQQLAVAIQERTVLMDAAGTLDRLGIAHDAVNAEKVIQPRSLDALFREAGVKVEVIPPTLEDFNDAHRRACLHLSPQPVGDKGEDEMRDLVIWSIALRVAKTHGGALLVSRDKIHTGDLGREEADALKLSVVPSVDEALRFFKIETPDAKLFIQMLGPVWSQLPGLGLAVPAKMSVLDVRHARFVKGAGGLASALANVHVGLESGAESTVGILVQEQAEGAHTVQLFDLADAGFRQASVAIAADVQPNEDPAYQEKLARLRKVLRKNE